MWLLCGVLDKIAFSNRCISCSPSISSNLCTIGDSLLKISFKGCTNPFLYARTSSFFSWQSNSKTPTPFSKQVPLMNPEPNLEGKRRQCSLFSSSTFILRLSARSLMNCLVSVSRISIVTLIAIIYKAVGYGRAMINL